MLALLFSVAIPVVWLFPHTPAGRGLRRLLVEWPVRAAGRMTPARWAFLTLAIIAVAAMVAYAEADGLMLVGPAIPEGIAWFALFDVATYLDAIGLLLLIAATVRLRASLDAARTALSRAKQWVDRCIRLWSRRAPGMRSRPARPARRGRHWDEGEGWRDFIAAAFRAHHLSLEPSA